MLKSMTGYGTVNAQAPDFDVHVEVKTLNSKFLDLILRVPREVSELEGKIRSAITDKLVRGKVMLSIDIVRSGDAEPTQQYNQGLFKKYYDSLKELADSTGASDADIFRLALESPDVISSPPASGLNAAGSDVIIKAVEDVLSTCNNFREEEGKKLSLELMKYVENIRTNLNAIIETDPQRMQRIDERLRGNISKVVEEEHIDENRLEQELIYYIEKLDITEEKVRLASHLDFFIETLNQPVSTGKKLGFISQEMGREINTIGSKANDAEIQKFVVQMKEELEKIKEQVLNIV